MDKARLVASIFLTAVSIVPAVAQSSDSYELAFMPRATDVTLLNEGGKYVAVDMKHIAQGERCRMDEGATVLRMGPGTTPGTTRLRYAAPQVSSGGCPFLTEFEISDSDYAIARAEFVKKQEEATRKVEQIKKDLGDKWNEIFGKKS
jgi:hypothetical protein